jgi:hypothetical protein
MVTSSRPRSTGQAHRLGISIRAGYGHCGELCPPTRLGCDRSVATLLGCRRYQPLCPVPRTTLLRTAYLGVLRSEQNDAEMRSRERRHRASTGKADEVASERGYVNEVSTSQQIHELPSPAIFGVSSFHYFWTAADSVTRMDPQGSALALSGSSSSSAQTATIEGQADQE